MGRQPRWAASWAVPGHGQDRSSQTITGVCTGSVSSRPYIIGPMEANEGKSGRGPGRPRVWASEAERKRAYRARLAADLAEPARLRLELRAAHKRVGDLERSLAQAQRDSAAQRKRWPARQRTATATGPPTRSSATRTATCGGASAAACGDEPPESGSGSQQGSDRGSSPGSGRAKGPGSSTYRSTDPIASQRPVRRELTQAGRILSGAPCGGAESRAPSRGRGKVSPRGLPGRVSEGRRRRPG